MTLLDEHRLTPDGRAEAGALIEEARQRQRKRRWFIGSIVVVVVVAAGVWAASGGGSASKPPSSANQPGHIKTPSGAPGSSKKDSAPGTSGVKRFLALVQKGSGSTFIATYRETYPKRQRLAPTAVVVAHRSGEWSASSSNHREYNPRPGVLVGCFTGDSSGSWQCGELQGGLNMSGGGYSIYTTEYYLPYGLAYQLESGLSNVSASSVHVYSRNFEHSRLTCLALRSGTDAGDTWCILPTGQFAYFWSDTGLVAAWCQEHRPHSHFEAGTGERVRCPGETLGSHLTA